MIVISKITTQFMGMEFFKEERCQMLMVRELTDEEIAKIYEEVCTPVAHMPYIEFARACFQAAIVQQDRGEAREPG
jgi:hypothetical protein